MATVEKAEEMKIVVFKGEELSDLFLLNGNGELENHLLHSFSLRGKGTKGYDRILMVTEKILLKAGYDDYVAHNMAVGFSEGIGNGIVHGYGIPKNHIDKETTKDVECFARIYRANDGNLIFNAFNKVDATNPNSKSFDPQRVWDALERAEDVQNLVKQEAGMGYLIMRGFYDAVFVNYNSQSTSLYLCAKSLVKP